MASVVTSFVAEHAGCFSAIGAVAAGYVGLKFLCSLLSGIKVYFLAPALNLNTDLKRLGSWAVVTGATDGIGKGYAQELARKGINIVLISRSPEKLHDVAQEIENKYKVKTKEVAVDFTETAAIYDKIRKELAGLEIGVLVNNVGMSYPFPKYYTEIDEKLVRDITNVNIHSVTMLTNIVLPSMVERKKGAIINIASGSGVFPSPLLTAYAASKSFVDFFSRGLQTEYKSKGIFIQVVLPFFVATKLSKIRRSSVMIPDPVSYARSALATVGVQERTFGCWSHALQGYVFNLIPGWVYQKGSMIHLSNLRKAALRRAQKKQ